MDRFSALRADVRRKLSMRRFWSDLSFKAHNHPLQFAATFAAILFSVTLAVAVWVLGEAMVTIVAAVLCLLTLLVARLGVYRPWMATATLVFALVVAASFGGWAGDALKQDRAERGKRTEQQRAAEVRRVRDATFADIMSRADTLWEDRSAATSFQGLVRGLRDDLRAAVGVYFGPDDSIAIDSALWVEGWDSMSWHDQITQIGIVIQFDVKPRLEGIRERPDLAAHGETKRARRMKASAQRMVYNALSLGLSMQRRCTTEAATLREAPFIDVWTSNAHQTLRIFDLGYAMEFVNAGTGAAPTVRPGWGPEASAKLDGLNARLDALRRIQESLRQRPAEDLLLDTSMEPR